MESQRVIVVGSGPCGAVAARELVRAGVPVTMLESGLARPRGLLVRARGRNLLRHATPLTPTAGTYATSGDPETMWFYHLAPGGLSNQWTGAVPRFAPPDFYEGARLHERYRWPLTYDELAPFYAEAERLLDVTATPDDLPALPAGVVRHERRLARDWQRIADVAKGYGQGFTTLPLADGPDWLFTRQGTAFNSFTSLVKPLLTSPSFSLRTGAHVLRLEWSGQKRRLTSVVYHDRATGDTVQLDAAAVVVACGALHSTKLLFDSACADFPEGLGNTDGVLGRYLHDHPKEWWSVATERPISRPAPAGYLTRLPYETSSPLLATSWTIGAARPRDRFLSLTPIKTRSLGVQVFGTMIPTEKYYAAPHALGTDEFGLRQLELNIRFDDEVRANVEAARQHFLALMEEAGYRCTLDPIEPQLVPGNAVHYGGTARMHQSREFGVLDQWNRPFDIPNLVVSDASCFTTNTEKNPTLTAMALSARAARRLAHDLRAG